MQMDWIKATILLIGLAVWVLSTLAKKREEPKRLRAPTPEPREDDESAAPRRRRTPSEVDKFLEEVRRRREAMEGRRPQPPPQPAVTQAPPPLPRRVPQPPPLPTGRPAREQREPTRRMLPPARTVIVRKPDLPRELQREFASPEEALSETLRVYGIVPADMQVFQKTEDGRLKELSAEEIRKRFGIETAPVQVAVAQSVPAASPATTATILGPVGASVSMRQALGLLQNRQSLVSAMILQEILQPPVCRRKGVVPAQRK